jgi:hypothetical protein
MRRASDIVVFLKHGPFYAAREHPFNGNPRCAADRASLLPCSIRSAAMQQSRMVNAGEGSHIHDKSWRRPAIMSRRMTMAVTTFDRVGGVEREAKAKGFARRLFDRFVDAQMQKARLRVNAYLQSLDDKALGNLGYTEADIKNIRARDASVGMVV